MLCDRIWRNARLATLSPGLPGLGIVEDGLIACSDGVIQFAGSAANAPRNWMQAKPSTAKAAGSRRA